MALILKDRVKETSTTSGTGTLTLAGAVTGYQSFSSAIGNGNTTYYAIYQDGGSDWEVGIGTVGAGTLARTVVLASSNSGSLVSFSGAQLSVWCDYPAGKAVYIDANGNISNLAGSISTINAVTFNTSYATTLSAGQLGWDGNNTLGLGMAGGNVIQRIGEDVYMYVKASSAITKGQLCMFTGAVGSSSVITAAPSAGVTNGQYIIGIAAESIALNGFGLIQVLGNLKGFDTSAFTTGDILYYDSANIGGLTNTYPTSGPIVTVCAVTNAGSGGSGSVQIRPSVTQRITAGTAISVSQTTTGTTVTNTAPDQTVFIASGTGISVTGTYPNFTVTNTSPSSGGTVTSVGSGTGLTGGPITGSGTLSIANTTVTAGSYTNASITVNAQGQLTAASSGTAPVTSVTGTAPVVSSGGTTPAISMPKATGSVDGYLSSTDWTTFNSKGSGSVTSVALTVPSGLSVTGSPVTTSGTLAISTTLSGIVKGTGTGFTTATSGTDYAPATSGTSILYGNGAGGFSNVTVGSGLTFSAGTLSASGGTPAGSNTQVQYNNSGAFGASANFTFNSTTGDLTAPEVVASNGLHVNSTTVSNNYTVASGNNAMSVGPITVASGKSVTISSGQRWVIL